MHFSGIIFTNKREDVDSILTPYAIDYQVAPYRSKSPEQLREEAEKYASWAKLQINKLSKKDDEYSIARLADIKSDYIYRWNSFSCEQDYKNYIQAMYKTDEDGYELSTFNNNATYDWYQIGGRYSDLLFVGEYNTTQANKDYLTKVIVPDVFIDLNGEWHTKDSYSTEKWNKLFNDYYNSVDSSIFLTVIDFSI